MRRILTAVLLLFGFSSICFAATSDYETSGHDDENSKDTIIPDIFYNDLPRRARWVAFEGNALFDFAESSSNVAKPSVYYNLGVNIGGNFSEYLGVQAFISLSPPVGRKKSLDLLADVMLIVQKDVNGFSSGFRPYFGIGAATEAFFYSEFVDTVVGYGLASEVGLRYFYKDLLVGVNANCNYYFGSYTSSAGSLEAVFFSHLTVRAGVSVGFVF